MSNSPTIIPELQTDRLLLVSLSLEHSQGMFELWSDAEVCRYSGQVEDIEGNPIPTPARSPSDSDKIIRFWIETAALGKSGGFRWALLLRETRDFVGIAGFNSVGEVSEYAYHLMPTHWGKGLMSEVTVVALNWIRGLGLCSEFEAFIEPGNVRSISLIERLGFTRTDVFEDGAQRFRMSAKALN